MRAVISDWQPRNRITTPLAGSPSYINSGIIKTVMKSGEKISVAQIDYPIDFSKHRFHFCDSRLAFSFIHNRSGVFHMLPPRSFYRIVPQIPTISK